MNSQQTRRMMDALEKLGVPSHRIEYAGGTYGVELGALDEAHVTALERVPPMLELLRRLRGESLLEATSLDLERQAGGRVWTVRLIIARTQPAPRPGSQDPTFNELIAVDAIRLLSPSAGNADSADVVELAAPANVTPAASREWAVLVADRLAGLGFNAAAAPAWGRS